MPRVDASSFCRDCIGGYSWLLRPTISLRSRGRLYLAGRAGHCAFSAACVYFARVQQVLAGRLCARET